jgi:hypothetical protein
MRRGNARQTKPPRHGRGMNQNRRGIHQTRRHCARRQGFDAAVTVQQHRAALARDQGRHIRQQQAWRDWRFSHAVQAIRAGQDGRWAWN